MTRQGSPEADILDWLAQHDGGTIVEIGQACDIDISSVRGRLKYLEKMKLISVVRANSDPPIIVYRITVDGRSERRI